MTANCREAAARTSTAEYSLSRISSTISDQVRYDQADLSVAILAIHGWLEIEELSPGAP
jgi:hypothetical protein